MLLSRALARQSIRLFAGRVSRSGHIYGATCYQASVCVPRFSRGVVLRSNWNEGKSRARPKRALKNRLIMGLLVLMPVVSFALGTWQVQRLKWKVGLITRAEENLRKPADTLAADVDARDLNTQDYTRVRVSGTFDHQAEQLVGPRVLHGRRGYLLVTPLVRGGGASRVLVVRGWVDEAHKDPSTRPASLVTGEQTVECLVREKPLKNMFTPEGPAPNEYHFMDIDAMADRTQSDAVYLEALRDDNADADGMCASGVPIGAVPTIAYRNAHFQYILTWYGICVFSTIMLFSMYKQRRPPSAQTAKLAHARRWQ